MSMNSNTQIRVLKQAYSLWQKLLFWIPLAAAAGCFAFALAVELLPIEMSMENREQFYRTQGLVSFYSCILLNAAYGRNYGLSWLKSLLFAFLSFQLVFSYASGFNAQLDIFLFGNGGYASYRSAVLLPLLCVILARFCKVDTLNLCDYLTPYFIFHHGVVTVACWIQGCCAGKPQSWGLLNPRNGMTVFPLQPCVILLSVAVAYWGLIYAKKQNYRANGMVFANSLIIYGCVRYVLELLSDDARMLGVMSWLGICSLVFASFGFLVRRISEKHYQTL